MSTQEASELEYLAGELEDAERALRRVVSLRERANEYEAERNTLVTERDAKQRELKRVRRGFLGAWLLVRGEHVERVQVLERALSRIEQRLAMKDRAISSAMSELRGAEQEAKRKPIDALRESFEARTSALREHLASESPERAAALRTLELELGGARLARDAADVALRQVHEVARLLESARVHLEASLRQGFKEVFVFGEILAPFKYAHVDRASRALAAAGQLMRDMRALDTVRDDLEPLAPDIGKMLRIADFALESFAADLSTMTRTENSLEGVHEAQRLFADLEPRIAQEARVARTHAENIERRFRGALIAACD